MALTDDEQELLNFGLAALPSWVRKDDDALRGAAKQIGAARRQWDYWYSQTLIGQATGATTTQPDWLNQHARDRGTNRQSGEDDPTLRQRLRIVEESITRSAILDAANAILESQGLGDAAMIETPRDGAHSGTFTAETGTGGTFAAGTGTTFLFTPTVPFKRSPWRDPSVVRLVQRWALVVTSAAHSGNNGGFSVTGALGKAAQYTNASGFAGADATAAWRLVALDRRNNILGDALGTGGNNMAFASRGFRSVSPSKRIFLILPYGTTPAVSASITEMLRIKKAAGVAVTIETRLDP